MAYSAHRFVLAGLFLHALYANDVRRVILATFVRFGLFLSHVDL